MKLVTRLYTPTGTQHAYRDVPGRNTHTGTYRDATCIPGRTGTQHAYLDVPGRNTHTGTYRDATCILGRTGMQYAYWDVSGRNTHTGTYRDATRILGRIGTQHAYWDVTSFDLLHVSFCMLHPWQERNTCVNQNLLSFMEFTSPV